MRTNGIVPARQNLTRDMEIGSLEKYKRVAKEESLVEL